MESLRLARGEKVQSGAVRRSPRWVAHTTAATTMVLVDVAGWISSSLLLPLQQGQALPVAQLVCGQQGTARYATTHTKLIQTHSSETATIECVPTDCGHCPIEHAALQTGGELVTLRQKVQKARCKKTYVGLKREDFETGGCMLWAARTRCGVFMHAQIPS